ncbi:MAG TPA: prepilin peptidase [Clostridia bacterium]|nr:prepilin peptidase [Clostridia bacterium]
MPDLIFIFALGLLTGSFLNVCIYRIPVNQSITFPPSHCTNCKTKLKPVDLIPVLSYLIYKGKCRYCGEKISLQYPLVEILNGLIYILIFINFGYSMEFIFYSILSSLLIVIGVIDYKHTIIPDGLIIFGLIAGSIYRFILPPVLKLEIPWIDSILGLLIGGGFFLLIAIVIDGGMGGGDIKLMGMLGFFLGFKKIIMVTFLSFFIGALFTLPLLALKKKGRKDMIPFGPFIALSALITMLYYNELLNLYFKIMQILL